MKTPLISVIIPSYNSENYLAETIHSVQNQSYENWECIIIDDGSTDQTNELVKKIITLDSRIHYYYQENSGLSASRNFGIAIAKGDYIQLLDSDDVLFEDKFQIMIHSYLSSQAKSVIYFSDFEFTLHNQPFETDHTIKKLYKDISKIGVVDFKKLYKAWDLSFIIPTHAFLFPREVFQKHGYDSSLKSKEDWDFYLSILSSNDSTFQYVAYKGCGYRMRPNSMSQDLTKLYVYAMTISYKWGRNKFAMYLKLSQYLLQAYFAKLKKKEIKIKEIKTTINSLLKKRILVNQLMIHVLMPLVIIKKIHAKFK